jgi:hypothetical protein
MKIAPRVYQKTTHKKINQTILLQFTHPNNEIKISYEIMNCIKNN